MNKDHELTSSPTYHQAVKTLLVLSTGAYAWEKPTLVISNLYVTTTVDHSRMRGSYMCQLFHMSMCYRYRNYLGYIVSSITHF